MKKEKPEKKTDPLLTIIDKRRAKELSSLSKLSSSIIYRIVEEFITNAKSRGDSFWAEKFIEWFKTEDTNEIVDWLLKNYCSLNIDRPSYPNLNLERAIDNK